MPYQEGCSAVAGDGERGQGDARGDGVGRERARKGRSGAHLLASLLKNLDNSGRSSGTHVSEGHALAERRRLRRRHGRPRGSVRCGDAVERLDALQRHRRTRSGRRGRRSSRSSPSLWMCPSSAAETGTWDTREIDIAVDKSSRSRRATPSEPRPTRRPSSWSPWARPCVPRLLRRRPLRAPPLELLDGDAPELAAVVQQPVGGLRAARHVGRQPVHLVPLPAECFKVVLMPCLCSCATERVSAAHAALTGASTSGKYLRVTPMTSGRFRVRGGPLGEDVFRRPHLLHLQRLRVHVDGLGVPQALPHQSFTSSSGIWDSTIFNSTSLRWGPPRARRTRARRRTRTRRSGRRRRRRRPRARPRCPRTRPSPWRAPSSRPRGPGRRRSSLMNPSRRRTPPRAARRRARRGRGGDRGSPRARGHRDRREGVAARASPRRSRPTRSPCVRRRSTWI